jgi:acyl homoserine lactone synthase
MIKVVYAADLYRKPILAASMYRDRAQQFKERLGWEVSVDDQGLEFDQYDELNPIYIIVEDESGGHLGSGRILPTTGRTMMAEHFEDLTGGVTLNSPLIWEITRFCVSPRLQDRRSAMRVPTALLWAGCDLAVRSGVEFCVGVFNQQMLRVYKLAGFVPEVLGTRETPNGTICGGLWEITPDIRDQLAERARLAEQGTLTYFPSADRFPFCAPAEPAPRAFWPVTPAAAAQPGLACA